MSAGVERYRQNDAPPLSACLAKNRVGSIRVKGIDIKAVSTGQLSRQIAYVPQATTTVFPHRVLDMVVMGRTPHIGLMATPAAVDLKIAREALAELGISHLTDCLFSEISGGERQLVLIARAITQQAEMLIMDEPTSSLDYGNQVRILKVINQLAKRGYSILMTSHFPNHAFLLCNKVLLMKQGRLSAVSSPEEFSAFLLSCFVSVLLGTSFGTVGTIGVVLITLAKSGNVDVNMAAGAIIAGVYFGDR